MVAAPAPALAAAAAPAARIDPTVEVLHGMTVADPYRWLEDGSSAETRAWVAAQNARTRAALDALPARPALHDRLTGLLRVPTVARPRLRGSWVFTLERDGTRDQPVLVRRSAVRPAALARVLVDPAAATGDATAAVDWFHPSPDGELVAYGLSRRGDERSTLHLLDVRTGRHLPERIPHTRAASVAWLPDASAFAYTRYPDPAVVGQDEAGYHRTVWWHRVGADPADDVVVWGQDDLPERTAWPSVSVSPDGRWLLVHLERSPSQVDVHLIERGSGRRTVVIADEEAVTDLEVVGDRLVGTTTLDAPRGRVVTADVGSPRSWRTLVAQGDDAVACSVVAGPSLLVASTAAGVARLHRHGLADGEHDEVALPDLGTITGIDADPRRERAVLTFTSFARPPELLGWTPAGVRRWAPGSAALPDADAYRVERTSYPAGDGVEVPLLLFRRAATTPSPDTPAVLTGYGGFGFVNGPVWSPLSLLVADAGGLAAVAGVRGGGEHGAAWHLAGSGAHKQRAVDDLVAAADWLVHRGLTARRRLALRGASNGGLLVAAALAQRPDLCRAVHCAVPLADMVRYPRFPVGELWLREYGDPDDRDDLARLLAWSPYHRAARPAGYPAVLITAGDHDTRVDPCHARKLAARLQAATTAGPDRPVLLHVDTQGGHGIASPLPRQADDGADAIAFLLDQLAAGPVAA